MQIIISTEAAARPFGLPRRPSRYGGAGRAVVVVWVQLVAVAWVLPAAAQQFVTDDAFVVDPGACQLEGWHSEPSTWVLPACHFSFAPGLEATAGFGLVRGDTGRAAEYVLQGKYLLFAGAEEEVGVALVAGVGFGPLSQVVGDGVAGAFAYVPLSVLVVDGALALHANLGWEYDREEHDHDGVRHEEGHHALTWAARGDLLVPGLEERLTLIGELFGANRGRPEYQVGVRAVLIPDRLLSDLSWGGHTARDPSGVGWAFGLAWTPPPIARTPSAARCTHGPAERSDRC